MNINVNTSSTYRADTYYPKNLMTKDAGFSSELDKAKNLDNDKTMKNGYESSGEPKVDSFYSNLSDATERATEKSVGDVLSLTMIPYDEMNSYGMVAKYSSASTEKDPIIQVSSNYGGVQRCYDVHVNQVNMHNASELEMFAVCAYTDDVGITERGSFGSFSRMKVYAMNSADNGDSASILDPKKVAQRLDWLMILACMGNLYDEIPEAKKQAEDCKGLLEDLNAWKGNANTEINSNQSSL